MNKSQNTKNNIALTIVQFYLYSSMHIALSASLLTAFSYLSIGVSPDWKYVFFVGVSTLLLYSAHRLIGINQFENYQSEGRFAIIIAYKRHIILISVLSLIYCLYAYSTFIWARRLLLIIPIIISAAYSLPLFRGKRLRDMALIKIFLIALCWGFITSVIPNYEQGSSIHNIIWLGIERALFLFAITIPFDIRDIKIDGISGVTTLASIFNISQLKKMSYLAILICTLISLMFYSTISFSSMCITYIITLGLVYNTSKTKSDYYFTGWIDGSMAIPFIVYYVLEILS